MVRSPIKNILFGNFHGVQADGLTSVDTNVGVISVRATGPVAPTTNDSILKISSNKIYMYYHRHSIRLPEFDYSTPCWYFVTICTHPKKCWFGDIKNGKMVLNTLGKCVESEWLKTTHIRPNVRLDDYVIMPDHLHGSSLLNVMWGKSRWGRPGGSPLQNQRLNPIHWDRSSDNLNQWSANKSVKWI